MRIQPSYAPTTKQIDFVFALQKRHRLTDDQLNQLCDTRFGRIFNMIDRGQMSTLIDEMLAWQTVPAELQRIAGQIDLPGMEA